MTPDKLSLPNLYRLSAFRPVGALVEILWDEDGKLSLSTLEGLSACVAEKYRCDFVLDVLDLIDDMENEGRTRWAIAQRVKAEVFDDELVALDDDDDQGLIRIKGHPKTAVLLPSAQAGTHIVETLGVPSAMAAPLPRARVRPSGRFVDVTVESRLWVEARALGRFETPLGTMFLSSRRLEKGGYEYVYRVPRREATEPSSIGVLFKNIFDTLEETEDWFAVDTEPFPNPSSEAVFYCVSTPNRASRDQLQYMVQSWEDEVPEMTRQLLVGQAPPLSSATDFIQDLKRLRARIPRRCTLLAAASAFFQGQVDEAMQFMRNNNFHEVGQFER